MKATLSFTLPEDREEFQLAQDGWKYKSVIDELFQKLNRMGDAETPKGARLFHTKTTDYVRSVLVALLEEGGLL